MLELIGVVLILVGFSALVFLGAVMLSIWLEEVSIEVRRPGGSDPVEDSLAAAGRISAAAFEAEALMHTAAQQAKRGEEEQG